MTETEKKALALTLLNEVCAEMGLDKVSSLELDMPGERALVRAIEQHEAFRREVSDAVEDILIPDEGDGERAMAMHNIRRFIIAKPDPLVEVLESLGLEKADEWAPDIRKALAARGGRIVWEGE